MRRWRWKIRDHRRDRVCHRFEAVDTSLYEALERGPGQRPGVRAPASASGPCLPPPAIRAEIAQGAARGMRGPLLVERLGLVYPTGVQIRVFSQSFFIVGDHVTELRRRVECGLNMSGSAHDSGRRQLGMFSGGGRRIGRGAGHSLLRDAAREFAAIGAEVRRLRAPAAGDHLRPAASFRISCRPPYAKYLIRELAPGC